MSGAAGGVSTVRMVTVALDAPARGGDREVRVRPHRPPAVTAAQVAELPRRRWGIEGAFARWRRPSAGVAPVHPRAAPFASSAALCASNVPAVIEAGIRAAREAAAVPAVSGYQAADEVAGVG